MGKNQGKRRTSITLNFQSFASPIVAIYEIRNIYMSGIPRYGFRKASTGPVSRVVASGSFANGRSLPLAALTRRLNPDLGAAGHVAGTLARF
jgi:hypothetical protein